MSAEDNDRLDARDYLCYYLLRELDSRQRDGRSVTRTQFLKLPCIADHYLSSQFGIDVELPRYWYQYGEILNEQPLAGSYYNVTPGEWGGRRVQPAPGVSETVFDVSEDVRQRVHEVIRQVVSEFANRDSKAVKDFQYEHYAPNDFVRLFDEFREFVRDQKQQNATLADFVDGTIQSPEERGKELLDDLLVEYPADLYSDTYDLFLRWEDTTRLLLDDGEFDRARELLDDFWETFSKVELRLHHQHNTPQGQERRWRNERDDELSAFDARLTEVREEVLAGRETSDVFDSVARSGSPDGRI